MKSVSDILQQMAHHIEDSKGKGKVHPITGHEGQEGEYRGIALIFL
jgi:hypothetical protein